MTVLALVFLFNLAFSTLWPVLLIVGGLALILTGIRPGLISPRRLQKTRHRRFRFPVEPAWAMLACPDVP